VVHSKNQGCSQSSAVGDEQGDRGNRSANVCCRPRSVANAAKLLTTEEREDVKSAGFGAFLDLKLETPCKPKEAHNLMSVSELKEDHIAMRVHPDVTLNFRPDILEKLMKLPHAPPSRESSQEKMKYLNTKY